VYAISKAITLSNRHVAFLDALTGVDERRNELFPAAAATTRRSGACEYRARRKSFTDARFSAPTAAAAATTPAAAAAAAACCRETGGGGRLAPYRSKSVDERC